jgi:hypothetical protein
MVNSPSGLQWGARQSNATMSHILFAFAAHGFRDDKSLLVSISHYSNATSGSVYMLISDATHWTSRLAEMLAVSEVFAEVKSLRKGGIKKT